MGLGDHEMLRAKKVTLLRAMEAIGRISVV